MITLKVPKIYDKYLESKKLFLNENFDCDFGDLAFELGNIALTRTINDLPRYGEALSYFMEAEYAVSCRNRSGDDEFLLKIKEECNKIRKILGYEKKSQITIVSLDYIFMNNGTRLMSGTVEKIDDKLYSLTVKRQLKAGENDKKLFIVWDELYLCCLCDEICIKIRTNKEIPQGTFAFDDVLYHKLLLNDTCVYEFDESSKFILSNDF